MDAPWPRRTTVAISEVVTSIARFIVPPNPAFWHPRCRASSGRQPVVIGEESPQARVGRRQRRNRFPDERALPPGVTRISRRRELVAIVEHADVTRRGGREWVRGEQAERAGIIVKELPQEVRDPWLAFERRECREPNLPVDARLVGRDHTRAAHRIA